MGVIKLIITFKNKIMGLEVVRDAIVSIVLFAAVFGLIYVYLVSRHRERMTILEKNIASPFNTVENTNLLKYGIICLGIAAGTIAGYLLYDWGVDENFAYTSMVFLFGGISLIVAFFVVQKQNKQ
jgi:preprotein translocase subunit YajC